MKPKFKQGDCIQQGGAPSVVYLVAYVTEDTYVLESPDPNEEDITLPHATVDASFVKNAREYKRQEARHNKVPATPGFDEEGFPTFENDGEEPQTSLEER